MNRYPVILFTCIASISSLTASQGVNAGNVQVSQDVNIQAPKDALTGAVIETMDAGSYTYVQVDLGEEKIWVAGPITTVKVGDILPVNKRMPMNDFHSKTLNRDFDEIYFVSSFDEGLTKREHQPHNNIPQMQPVMADIKKAQDGKNIKEIYSQMNELSGKTVRIRGVVSKYTPDVLGKDWIHLRDNSSSSDLTVTTKDKVKMGDVVLAEGTLKLNSDFGYGYIYKVIMEEAKVTVE